jgi:hypothetical protein
MPCPLPARRVVALLAAYAIALQALLSAFSGPLQAAPMFLGVICSGIGPGEHLNDSVPQPAHDQTRAACILCGCGAPPPVHAGAWAPIMARPAVRPVAATQPFECALEPPRAWPQSPRAPPT